MMERGRLGDRNRLGVVVLAAGQGTRMESDLPKVLHPLAGRPMISNVLEVVETLEPDRLVLVVGYGGDLVRAEVGSRAVYAQQAQRMGTGHAVMQAEPAAEGCRSILVLYGDMPLVRASTLRRLCALHAKGASPITMLVVRSSESRGFGRIIRDNFGRVSAIVEEGDCTPAQLRIQELNPGVYCFDADWLWTHLGRLPLHQNKGVAGEYFLTDLVAMAVAEGHIISDVVSEDPLEALGVNTPQHLHQAEDALRSRRAQAMECGEDDERMFSAAEFFDLSTFEHRALFEDERVVYVWDALRFLKEYLDAHIVPDIRGVVMPGAYLLGEQIFIGEGTVVEPGAVIKGPAHIGANTQVRSGAYVRERVLVGERCIVGHTTEIKNSVMLDGSQAGHFAYIGDSILGNAVNLGAGTKLANLKLDRSNIRVKVDGRHVDTGMHKLGAILGDKTQVGCNTVTNPGTLMGPGCVAYALTCPYGYYPRNSVLKGSMGA